MSAAADALVSLVNGTAPHKQPRLGDYAHEFTLHGIRCCIGYDMAGRYVPARLEGSNAGDPAEYPDVTVRSLTIGGEVLTDPDNIHYWLDSNDMGDEIEKIEQGAV